MILFRITPVDYDKAPLRGSFDGGSSSVGLEHRIVAPKVEGSSLFSHLVSRLDFLVGFLFLVCAPIFKNLQKSSKIFKNLQKSSKIFKNLQKSSKIFKNLQKSSNIFEYLRNAFIFESNGVRFDSERFSLVEDIFHKKRF